MELKIKTVSEMSALEVIKLYQQRVAVFVVEQECAYQEADQLDERAVHIWYEEEGEVAAYTRVIAYDTYSSFGRVLVNKAYRGKGLGRKIVATGLTYIENNYIPTRVEISGQAYLEKFYQSFGFEAISDIYLEDNIPHRAMALELLSNK